MFEVSCKSGVYAIRNVVSGKLYVGSAVDLARRKKDHFRMLRGDYHHSAHLQAAFNRDGEAAFVFFPLAFVPDVDRLIEVEQAYIDSYGASHRVTGYNARPKAQSNLGKEVRPETRELLRLANLGKKQSAETIEKRFAPLRGRPLSQAHREALGASRRGSKRPDVRLWAPEKLSRFSREQVLRMRADHSAGATFRALAEEFGSCAATIYKAVRGIGAFYSGI